MRRQAQAKPKTPEGLIQSKPYGPKEEKERYILQRNTHRAFGSPKHQKEQRRTQEEPEERESQRPQGKDPKAHDAKVQTPDEGDKEERNIKARERFSRHGKRPPRRAALPLLDFHFGAHGLELCLDFLGLFLADAFLDGFWRVVHKVFGLLEAKAGDGPDFLDHLEFLRTSTL